MTFSGPSRATTHGSASKKILLLLAGVCLVFGCLIVYRESVPTLVISRTVTHVPLDADAVRVLVTGDTGTGTAAQKQVATLLEKLCVKKNPDAVLLLGDNFYMDGVFGLDDLQWKSKFEDVYSSPCLKKLKFYVVLGNHDYRGSPNSQIAYTQKSNFRWNMPARAYQAAFGNLLDVFAADTNFPDMCGLSFLCSMDWLMAQMKASQAAWKVVIGHHPIFSGGKYQQMKPLAGLTLPRLICGGKADFYLAGHDHNMQHLVGSNKGFDCRINQLVVGSGGADLYDLKALEGKTKFAVKALGAVSAEFRKTQATFEFFNTSKPEPQYFFRQEKAKN